MKSFLGSQSSVYREESDCSSKVNSAMCEKDDRAAVGIIFPILRDHIQRLLEGKKTVFVKFVGNLPKRLHPGSKLFFYESRSKKEIVGEARIVEISSGTPQEVLQRFRNDLFLTATEFEKYIGDRKSQRVLVLILTSAKRYRRPLKIAKAITMTGQYMTKQMLRSLRAF